MSESPSPPNSKTTFWSKLKSSAAVDLLKKENISLFLEGQVGLMTFFGMLCTFILICMLFGYTIYVFIGLSRRKDLNLTTYYGLNPGFNITLAYSDSNYYNKDFPFPEPTDYGVKAPDAPEFELAFRGNFSFIKHSGTNYQILSTYYPLDFNFTYWEKKYDWYDGYDEWKNLNLTCSESLLNELKKNGWDTREFFCIKQNSQSNPLPNLPQASSTIYITLALERICMKNLAVDPSNYEKPFTWPLSCVLTNFDSRTNKISIDFRAIANIIETDHSYIFSSKNKTYAWYYEIAGTQSAAYSNNFFFYGFEITVYPTKVYYYYSRAYNKIFDAISSIGGFHSTVTLIATILLFDLFYFWEVLSLYRYFKTAEEDWNLLDYLNFRVFRKKQITRRFREMEAFVREKLELSNLINSTKDEEKLLEDKKKPTTVNENIDKAGDNK